MTDIYFLVISNIIIKIKLFSKIIIRKDVPPIKTLSDTTLIVYTCHNVSWYTNHLNVSNIVIKHFISKYYLTF